MNLPLIFNGELPNMNNCSMCNVLNVHMDFELFAVFRLTTLTLVSSPGSPIFSTYAAYNIEKLGIGPREWGYPSLQYCRELWHNTLEQ